MSGDVDPLLSGKFGAKDVYAARTAEAEKELRSFLLSNSSHDVIGFFRTYFFDLLDKHPPRNVSELDSLLNMAKSATRLQFKGK